MLRLPPTQLHNSRLTLLLPQFFLELWQDILRDPLLRKQAEGCPLLPKIPPEGPSTGTPNTVVAHETVFDEMISRYQKVISRAEDMSVQQVCGEIEAGLRTHFNASAGYVPCSPLRRIYSHSHTSFPNPKYRIHKWLILPRTGN